MNENKTNICPGCGRGCSLDDPHCPRGEAYARGETPADNLPAHGHPAHGHSGPHGEHGHHGEHGPHGEHGGRGKHGRHPHGEHGPYRKGPRPEGMDSADRLLHLLGKLHHQSRRHFDGKSAQHHILHLLQEHGPMTQRDVTEQLGVQPGSASEILKKLETAGHIRRSPSTADRRTTDVSLTDDGAALARQREAMRSERKSQLLAALSEEEVQQLLSLLEKLSKSWDRPPHSHNHE